MGNSPSACYNVNSPSSEFYRELVQQDDCPSLFSTLKDLEVLSSLSLNLAEIDAQHLQNLDDSIKHLKLSTLALDFRHNVNFSISKMEAVSQCLTSLAQSLEGLKLYFSSNFAPNKDQEIAELCKGLNHLERLISLTLGLSEGFGITKVGMQALSSSLKNQKLLSALSLDLNGCCRSPNTGLFYLFFALQHLTQVSTLSLNLSNCCITPVEVYALSSNIQQLELLTTLALSFNRHKGDTAQEISNLLHGIPALKRLSNLSLSFSSCDTKSADLFHSLVLCLEKVECLVYLGFRLQLLL